MADYTPTVITKKGLKVLQNVVQGKQLLTFSKMEVGIGQVQNADDIENLESLVDSKITADIVSIKSNDDGSCSVVGSYTNEGMTDSYILNEVGVFVKDENNKDVLYAYSTADGNGDWFGAGSTILKEIIEMVVYISTATNITANIAHTVFASEVDMDGTDVRTVIIGMQGDIEKLKTSTTNTTNSLNAHTGNKNNPHDVTKEQIGLGSVVNGALSSSITSTSTTTYANSNAVKLVNDKVTANASDIASLQASNTNGGTALNAHIANKTNPHGVTKEQVGLGSVVNGTLSSSITSTSTTTYANSNAVKLVNDKVTTNETSIDGINSYIEPLKVPANKVRITMDLVVDGDASKVDYEEFQTYATYNDGVEDSPRFDKHGHCSWDIEANANTKVMISDNGNDAGYSCKYSYTIDKVQLGKEYKFTVFAKKNNSQGCYDVIVKTQAEFSILTNSSTWGEAKSVALVGNFTCNKVLIVPNTVLQIDGYNDCTIDFGTTSGLLFRTQSGSSKCKISGITVKGNTTSSSSGFYQFNSLTDCIAKNSGSAGSIGFNSCNKLLNCITNNTSDITYDIEVNGFYLCNSLTDCSANNPGRRGFYKCDYLVNCLANNDGSIVYSDNECFGFDFCINLTNCTATIDTLYHPMCFASCDNLSNCNAYTSKVNDYDSTGFTNCNNLTSCNAYNKSKEYCEGFSSCNNLTNCTAYNSSDTTCEYSYGFIHCTGLTNCTASNSSEICDKTDGFYYCNNLTNCTANNKSTNTYDTNYGFISCKYINNARKGTGFTGVLWSGTTVKRDENTCDLA